MASVLKAFAVHTGFRKEKDLSDADMLAQKYLAVHMRMIHPSIVYPYVGKDYTLLSLRTHSPALESYCTDRAVDVPAYVYLMKHGYANVPPTEEETKSFPALQHFRDNMMPKPVGEETWVDYDRTDHWKARAYFIGLNWKNAPEFYNLARAIYMEDLITADNRKTQDAFSDFYQALTQYEPYHELEAKEIGAILGGLHLEEKIGLLTAVPEAKEPEAIIGDELTHGDVPEKDPLIFVSDASEASLLSWSDIQGNDWFQRYRKEAGLNVTFSPKKTVKQMIFSSLGLNVTDVPGAESIIPLSQPMGEALPAVPQEAWPMLVGALETMDISKHTLNPDSPMLRDMLPGGETNALSTIQTVLTMYHPQCKVQEIDPRIKARLLKAYPKVDESVVQSILEM